MQQEVRNMQTEEIKNEDRNKDKKRVPGRNTPGEKTPGEGTPSEKILRERLMALAEDSCVRQKDTTNGMMAPEFLRVDPESATAVFRYIVRPWEANRVGGLHGGVMASMLDHACGLTATAWLGHWAPTMSMNIDYIRPAEIGDRLLAAATVVSFGRRLIRMRGELRNEATGKVVAACSATFFNKED